MAASNAERQKAFRERIKQRLAMPRTAAYLPAKPKISAPATKRWITMTDRARAELEARMAEMREYFDERSESWQEDERGEAFQERLDRLETIIEQLEQLDD